MQYHIVLIHSAAPARARALDHFDTDKPRYLAKVYCPKDEKLRKMITEKRLEEDFIVECIDREDPTPGNLQNTVQCALYTLYKSAARLSLK